MLNESENLRFARVGPGTPMGELMRRYWQPVAAVTELEDNPVKPVRLMGEDLTLYKDKDGNYGLVDRHCPHRRADLSYGYVEDCGLRCNYHGWLFDHTGKCIAQPFEEIANPKAKFKDKIRIKAYPVEAKGGLIWAYLGPEPAPLVPTWEPFTWKNGFRQIVFAQIPCNWFQCQENSIDPIHFEWMHANWGRRLRGESGNAPAHVKLGFEEFDYGYTYKRIREDTDEKNPLWTVGRVCLWPNALFTGDHFEWRVPVDDENTLSVTWHFARVPREREPYEQGPIPYWYGPIRDEKTGRWITSHVMNQDFVAWMGQGTITDRTQEHLGVSDRGITLIRERFRKDMEAIRDDGVDPKAIIRDPKINECVDLPVTGRKLLVDGMSMQEMIDLGNRTGYRYLTKGYNFQAGQPEDIRRAYQEAMGIDDNTEGVPG